MVGFDYGADQAARDAARMAVNARATADGVPEWGRAVAPATHRGHALDGDFQYAGAAAGAARSLFALLRAQKGSAGGSVSIHRCPHDEPASQWYSCREDARAQYEEG